MAMHTKTWGKDLKDTGQTANCSYLWKGKRDCSVEAGILPYIHYVCLIIITKTICAFFKKNRIYSNFVYIKIILRKHQRETSKEQRLHL